MPVGLWSFPHLMAALVVALGLLLPVHVLRHRVPGPDVLTRMIAASSLALGLWICLFYLIAALGIRATLVIQVVLIGSLAVVIRSGIRIPRLPALVWWSCSVCLLPYLTGFLVADMLPGCDSAMHGYITRLVMEQEGLPATLRPLLPVADFGGTSAGFHLLAASAACFQPPWLMAGLSAATAVANLMAVFGLALLLSLFARPNTALIVAMVVCWFNRALQTVVDWGGTPTMLALGLVLSAMAFIGYALRERSLIFALMGAIVWSAAALTHLIPAYAGLYAGLGLGVYWFWAYRLPVPFVLRSAGVATAATLVCLAPFALQMDIQRSPALLQRIREWQQVMMDHAITGDVYADVYRTLAQVKFSLSDLMMIAISAGLLWALVRHLYRTIALAVGLSLVLLTLVLNSGHWYLPFSELLYPERVMYFFVVPCGILLCHAAEDLGRLLANSKPRLLPAITALAVGVGCYNCFQRYVDSLARPDRRYDAPMREAFAWITQHTAPDAVIHVAYGTEGMWVPALSYRAAVGTHLHFVHEVQHVADRMVQAPVDHYVWRSIGDPAPKAAVDPMAEISAPAFANSAVELIQTRRGR